MKLPHVLSEFDHLAVVFVLSALDPCQRQQVVEAMHTKLEVQHEEACLRHLFEAVQPLLKRLFEHLNPSK